MTTVDCNCQPAIPLETTSLTVEQRIRQQYAADTERDQRGHRPGTTRSAAAEAAETASALAHHHLQALQMFSGILGHGGCWEKLGWAGEEESVKLAEERSH